MSKYNWVCQERQVTVTDGMVADVRCDHCSKSAPHDAKVSGLPPGYFSLVSIKDKAAQWHIPADLKGWTAWYDATKWDHAQELQGFICPECWTEIRAKGAA